MNQTFVLPNVGLQSKLQALAERINSPLGFAGLYIDTGVSLSDQTTLGNLTEPSYPGYARQTSLGAVVTGGYLTTVPTLTTNELTWGPTAATSSTIAGSFFGLSLVPTPGTTVAELIAVQTLPVGDVVLTSPAQQILSQLTITDQRASGQP